MTNPADAWTDPSGRSPVRPDGPAEEPHVDPPVDNQPGWGQPTGDQPTGDQPAWGQPTGSQFGGGQTAWGQPAPVAPKPGVVPLRPLGLGELLDGAVTTIRRYPKPTLGLSAVIALVATVINTAFALALQGSSASVTTPDGALDVGTAVSTASAAGPGLVISFLAGLVLTGVLTAVIGRGVLGRELTLAEAWQQIRPLLWQLLGLSLLTGLLIGLVIGVPVLIAVGLGVAVGPAGLAIGIPLGLAGFVAGVYLYVRLSLAPAALILERCGITQSLRRSGVLVHGSWWRIAGILVLTSIIGFFVSGVLQVPFGIFAAVTSDSSSVFAVLASQIGAGIAACLVTPFTTGVHALLYVDRRMRAEGLDVTLRTAATESPAA